MRGGNPRVWGIIRRALPSRRKALWAPKFTRRATAVSAGLRVRRPAGQQLQTPLRGRPLDPSRSCVTSAHGTGSTSLHQNRGRGNTGGRSRAASRSPPSAKKPTFHPRPSPMCGLRCYCRPLCSRVRPGLCGQSQPRRLSGAPPPTRGVPRGCSPWFGSGDPHCGWSTPESSCSGPPTPCHPLPQTCFFLSVSAFSTNLLLPGGGVKGFLLTQAPPSTRAARPGPSSKTGLRRVLTSPGNQCKPELGRIPPAFCSDSWLAVYRNQRGRFLRTWTLQRRGGALPYVWFINYLLAQGQTLPKQRICELFSRPILKSHQAEDILV